MNDLISLEKIAQWQKLKTLVLDSVSSPITKRVYNMALDEFMGWFQQAPRPGFTKATVSAWRVSLEDRGLGSSSIIIRMSAIRKLAAEAADNGLLAPEAGRRHQPREEREDARHPRRELAVAAAGAGSAERAGHHDPPRVARPRHPGRAPRLRPAALGSGRAHVHASPAARWPLVHRRPGRETRPGPHRADADLGEGGDRRVDVPAGVTDGHVFRSVNRADRVTGRRPRREGRLAAHQAVRRSSRRPRHRPARPPPHVRQAMPRRRRRA